MEFRDAYVGNRDGVLLVDAAITQILNQVLDEHRALGDGLVQGHLGAIA